MTALKSRDGQLATAQRQLQGLQEADANDKQSLADIIAGLRGISSLCPFGWSGFQVHEMQQMYCKVSGAICVICLSKPATPDDPNQWPLCTLNSKED